MNCQVALKILLIKIIVKDILKDNYNDFKNKYWCKIPKNMRKHIDEAVSKALKCSDIKYGFANSSIEDVVDI